MTNVLLSCSGGFSSSLVMSKIKKAAEQEGMELNIWAINQADIDTNIEKADILLIAPQIQYMAKEFQKKCNECGIPFAIISQMDYGRCNGESILKQIKTMLNL